MNTFSFFLRKKPFSATRVLASGFFISILLGTVLLMMPFSSAAGERTPLIDALFTATSSVCVTGLVTVPTFSHWSFFGQIIILLLIETGGLGIITFMIVFYLFMGKRIGLKERLLVQAAYNLDTMDGLVSMARNVLSGALIAELCGAVLIMPQFITDYGSRGIWISLFHAVSAFCNAGMDVIGPDSLVAYAGDLWINLVTSALIIIGGIGFPIWWILLKRIRSRLLMGKPRTNAPYPGLYLKVVLIMTGALLILVLRQSFFWNLITLKHWRRFLSVIKFWLRIFSP